MDKQLRVEPIEGNTYVNGQLIKEPTELHHNYRVILGSNLVFRVNNPFEEDESSNDSVPPEWHFAIKEFASHQNSAVVEALANSHDSGEPVENVVQELLVKLEEDREESKKILQEKSIQYDEKLKMIETLVSFPRFFIRAQI